MSFWLQKSASIQKRTSPLKFDHLAEKSEYGSISNLSTKVHLRTRVQIVQHAKEVKVKIGTVRLLELCVDGVDVVRAAPKKDGAPPPPKLKGSVGEGPNQTNYSDRSSVRIRSKFTNFC